MKKITKQAVEAFLTSRPGSFGNTCVSVCSKTGPVLFLHGNAIARMQPGKPETLEITTAGYNTPTTRNRLSGLPGMRVYVIMGRLYLNGYEWSGAWVRVADYKSAAEKSRKAILTNYIKTRTKVLGYV